jgi:hypothetical protein
METSLMARALVPAPETSMPGSESTSKSPASARSEPAHASSRSTVARKPISPKLIPNTGTSVPA